MLLLFPSRRCFACCAFPLAFVLRQHRGQGLTGTRVASSREYFFFSLLFATASLAAPLAFGLRQHRGQGLTGTWLASSEFCCLFGSRVSERFLLCLLFCFQVGFARGSEGLITCFPPPSFVSAFGSCSFAAYSVLVSRGTWKLRVALCERIQERGDGRRLNLISHRCPRSWRKKESATRRPLRRLSRLEP